MNGDTSSVFSGSLTTSATAGSSVGGYGINEGTLSAGANYTIAFSPGTLNITPATLQVSANSESKAYGAALPALTYSYSGLVNGNTSSVLSGALTTSASASSNVGSYGIDEGTLSAGSNYTIAYTAGTLTITPATLDVTADSESKTYGAALPTLTYSYSGLVNGDTSSVLSGALTTLASASSNVGSYGIDEGTLSAGSNYTITFDSGTLNITPATLDVTADSDSKVYGTALPSLTYSYTGLVNGDTSSSFAGALTTTATTASSVGAYGINQGTLSAGADYTITFSPGVLNITPATLHVTASNESKEYGSALPSLAYSYTGLVNGDTSSVFTGSLTTSASASSNVGSYEIDEGTLNAGSNYTIAYNAGTLTITPSTLDVTAHRESKAYGTALPSLTYSYTGFVNGDTSSVFTGALTTSATVSSNVGSYEIDQGTLSAGVNYSIAFSPGTLNVTPAIVDVIANNASMVYGAALPTLTYSYTGLVNVDTPSVFTGDLTTSASTVANVGSYGITEGTLNAGSNYAIAYTAGTLSITPAPLLVTADNAVKLFGEANPAFAVAYSGFVNGDTPDSLSGTLGFTTTATDASLPGTYPIVPAGLSSSNYAIELSDGELTVEPLSLTATGATVAAVEGVGFSGNVANFTAPDLSPRPAFYAATILWGDGQSSIGVVGFDASAGVYTVSGGHTYQAVGIYPLEVTLRAGGIVSASARGIATVEDAPLSVSGVGLVFTAGQGYSGVVAKVVDGDPSATSSDFGVTIQWGDGTVSAGTLTPNAAGNFFASGDHTFSTVGTFKVVVSVTDQNGGESSAANEVQVVAAPPTVVIPPSTGANPPATQPKFGEFPNGPFAVSSETAALPATTPAVGDADVLSARSVGETASTSLLPVGAPAGPPIVFTGATNDSTTAGSSLLVQAIAPAVPSAGVLGSIGGSGSPSAASASGTTGHSGNAASSGSVAHGAASGATAANAGGGSSIVTNALAAAGRQVEALLGALARAARRSRFTMGPQVAIGLPRARPGAISRRRRAIFGDNSTTWISRCRPARRNGKWHRFSARVPSRRSDICC